MDKDKLSNQPLNDNDFKKLIEGFKIYENFFNDNIFEFTFNNSNNQINKINIKFSSYNFMHLTGVKYEYGPQKFYKDLLDEKVSRENVRYKNNQTRNKLAVLPCLYEIINNQNVRIIKEGSIGKIKFSYIIRSNKGIIAVASEHGQKYLYPKSLLNLTTDKRLNNFKTYKVTEIKKVAHLYDK